MIPVAVIISLQAVLQKYGLGMVSFWTFFFWSFSIPILFYLLLLVRKSNRVEVKEFFTASYSKSSSMICFQNLASWTSEVLNYFVLSFLPVTIVKSIGSFQALFVNLISSRFSKTLRVENKEKIFFRRIFLFILIGIGIILTLK
jgi:hypothetical protein